MTFKRLKKVKNDFERLKKVKNDFEKRLKSL